MAKHKDYPPGEKPLVVRRSEAGIRIVSGLREQLGLNSMFVHREVKLGSATMELTLHTTDGDVRLRMVGYAETERPPDENGNPQEPHVNFTDLRFELVDDGRKGGKSDG